MRDLIEALTIFLKYGDHRNPTGCSHDVMTIYHIDPEDVSEADTQRLSDLGFFVSDEEAFISFRFGS
uniref:Uncharacterized protein n=1 Tax=viral metagenome TaxID=1070528 RepID=A0A6M3JHF5_9ZZZZ